MRGVYPEDGRQPPVREAVNSWLGELFHPDHVDHTVAALLGSQGQPHAEPSTARQRLADAEAKIRRYQQAIGAGIDPTALVEAINTAQAERAAARAELDNAPAPSTITEAEVHAMIDSLGDVGAALIDGKPERLAELYTDTGLQVCSEPETSTTEVSIRVNSACVRGPELHIIHPSHAQWVATDPAPHAPHSWGNDVSDALSFGG